jgi:hypothetical protein
MTKLVPFADDAASVEIDQLTIENGTERIALYGVVCGRGRNPTLRAGGGR